MSQTPETLAMDRGRAVLLIVDYQERLCAAMPGEIHAQGQRNVRILIDMARRLGVPVVVSQQYPKGLGPTIQAIEEALAQAGEVHRFDKVEFSVCQAPEFANVTQVLGKERDQWIVTGMETHVCVYQSVRALVEEGASVHVPCDAVLSRTKANWRVGLGLIERAGGIITSTETVVFDALGRAGGDDFKALSQLIK